MAIESATYLSQLDPANPAGSDPLADADNHLRLIKSVLKATFPNLSGPLTATPNDFKGLSGVGMVSMFYGDAGDVPAGWTICDGKTIARSDGTGNITVPDLRDIFVVGAGSTYAAKSLQGATSYTVTSSANGGHNHSAGAVANGSHSHGGGTGATALVEGHLPSHAHSLSFTHIGFGQIGNTGGILSLIVGGLNGATGSAGGGQGHGHGIAEDGSHSHVIVVDDTGNHQHSSVVPCLPRSMALYFIMRI